MSEKNNTTTRTRDAGKTIAILKKALISQLISSGFAGLSLAPLLKKAGVSKGALFHHFPSKDALVAAAFEDVLAEFSVCLHQISHKLRSGQIDREEFVAQTAQAFASDLFIATMEMSLGMRVEDYLSEAVKDAIVTWRKDLLRFWTETFDLPGLSEDQQEVHWAIASNTLRGYGFTNSFGHQEVATAHMQQGFAQFFLDVAVLKPATEADVIFLENPTDPNSGENK